MLVKSIGLFFLFFILFVDYIKGLMVEDVTIADTFNGRLGNIVNGGLGNILNRELGDIEKLTDLMKRISVATDMDTLRPLIKESTSLKTSENVSQMKRFYEAILDSQLHSDEIVIDEEKFKSILAPRIQHHLITNEDMRKKDINVLLQLTSHISKLIKSDLKIHEELNKDRAFVNDELEEIRGFIESSLKAASKALKNTLKGYSSISKDFHTFYNSLEKLVTELQTYYGDPMESLGLTSSQTENEAREQLLKLDALLGHFGNLLEDLGLLDKIKETLDTILRYLNESKFKSSNTKLFENIYSDYRSYLSKHRDLQHKLESNRTVKGLFPYSGAFFIKLVLPIIGLSICLIFFMFYK